MRHPTAHRWRVEVLDGHGLLLASLRPEHGHYAIRHRDGRAVACRTMVEAMLWLLRMAVGVDEPTTDTIPAGLPVTGQVAQQTDELVSGGRGDAFLAACREVRAQHRAAS